MGWEDWYVYDLVTGGVIFPSGGRCGADALVKGFSYKISPTTVGMIVISKNVRLTDR